MKPINLKNPNADTKLSDAIKAAEGKATARTLDVSDIKRIIDHVDSELKIPKKFMLGVKITCDVNAQTFPASYKYTPESTWFDAECKKTGWCVTDIYRWKTMLTDKHKVEINLTDEARKAIIDRFSKI